MLWTLDPAERDAFLSKESTKMFTKNNWVLVEIACTRSPLDLFKVKQAYQARYKKSLEEDVAQHTSGDLRKVYYIIYSTSLLGLFRVVDVFVLFFFCSYCFLLLALLGTKEMR